MGCASNCLCGQQSGLQLQLVIPLQAVRHLPLFLTCRKSDVAGTDETQNCQYLENVMDVKDKSVSWFEHRR